MTILLDHYLIYTKNTTFGAQNLGVPYSGVYGPDEIHLPTWE